MTTMNTADYTYIMFTNADDAPPAVSDLFERLIGHLKPVSEPCFELTRFDDTYIVAVPRAMHLPELADLCDNEAYHEFIMESN